MMFYYCCMSRSFRARKAMCENLSLRNIWTVFFSCYQLFISHIHVQLSSAVGIYLLTKIPGLTLTVPICPALNYLQCLKHRASGKKDLLLRTENNTMLLWVLAADCGFPSVTIAVLLVWSLANCVQLPLTTRLIWIVHGTDMNCKAHQMLCSVSVSVLSVSQSCGFLLEAGRPGPSSRSLY